MVGLDKFEVLFQPKWTYDSNSNLRNGAATFSPGGVLFHLPEHSCDSLYSEGHVLSAGNECGNIG